MGTVSIAAVIVNPQSRCKNAANRRKVMHLWIPLSLAAISAWSNPAATQGLGALDEVSSMPAASQSSSINSSSVQPPGSATETTIGPSFLGSPATVLACQSFPTFAQGCISAFGPFGMSDGIGPFTVTFTGLNAGVTGRIVWSMAAPVSVPITPFNFRCVGAPRFTIVFGSTGGAGPCTGSLTTLDLYGPPPLGPPIPGGVLIVMQAIQRDVLSGVFSFPNISEAVTFTK